ncbi:MAG TPA: DUF4136 domain-containing protein [Gemmatimonadales bacterium]|nr:DUF4136 domain-containing protein [Gemmatimonadales bacterium]
MNLSSSGTLLAGLALAAAACGPTITSDRDESIPMAQGATYVWAGGETVGKQVDPTVQNEIVHQRIQTSINKEMQEKGFRRIENVDEADFYVRYYLSLKRETSYVSSTTGVYGGYGWGWGYGYGGGVTTTTPIETTTGGLVVDVVQRQSNKLAWRGMIQGDAPDHPPSQREIDDAMGRIMKSLPVVK